MKVYFTRHATSVHTNQSIQFNFYLGKDLYKGKTKRQPKHETVLNVFVHYPTNNNQQIHFRYKSFSYNFLKMAFVIQEQPFIYVIYYSIEYYIQPPLTPAQINTLPAKPHITIPKWRAHINVTVLGFLVDILRREDHDNQPVLIAL